MEENLEKKQDRICNIRDVVCRYSPFPQSLKAGNKYKMMAEYKEYIAIVDETKELVIYNRCYFNLT